MRSEVTVTYNKFFANVCNSIFIIFIQYPPVRPLHSAQPHRRCGKEFCYPELAPGRGELHHEEVRVSRDEGDCRQSSLAGWSWPSDLDQTDQTKNVQPWTYGPEQKKMHWKYCRAIFSRAWPGYWLCPPPGPQSCRRPRLCQWTQCSAPGCGPGTRGSQGSQAAKSDDYDMIPGQMISAPHHHTTPQHTLTHTDTELTLIRIDSHCTGQWALDLNLIFIRCPSKLLQNS